MNQLPKLDDLWPSQPKHRIVVCERTDRWSRWLRRYFDASDAGIARLPTIALVEGALEKDGHAMVVFCTDSAESVEIASAIERLHQKSTKRRCMVVRELTTKIGDEQARLFFSAGATACVRSPFDVESVVAVAKRHFEVLSPQKNS